MIKIKFIKETAQYKIGEVVEVKEKEAEEIINRGYAEYKNKKDNKKLELIKIIREEKKIKKIEPKKEEVKEEENNFDRIKRINRILSTEYNKSPEQLKQEGMKDEEINNYVKESSDKRIYGKQWQIELDKFKQEKVEFVNKELQRISKLEEIERDLELDELKERSGISKRILNKRLSILLPPKEKEPEPSLIGQTTIYRQLSKDFINICPFTYDDSKIWWAWNKEEYRWEMVDECHMMNLFDKYYILATEDGKIRAQIIEALKKIGRMNKPIEVKPTWIQFNDTIVDIISGEKFKASNKYFITNPIPHELHKENFEGTPNMDRIFEEWVGKNHVKTLYEILAYCLLPDYPIHRIFCFIGGGLNGKSKFLELLRKFIGEKNVCCTELDILLTSRFEVTRLHKKLVCQMGETNFNEMSKTSILKKLSGGDLIGFEYKRANLFEEKNYAKILISTNNLPTTTDKTMGFYRRWMIVDFPNQFSEKKDILLDIPEDEYKSLALKSISILKDLLSKREFTNEGTIEERQKKYEDRSDPLEKFLKEFVIEEFDGHIWKGEFEKKLNQWNKENRHREMSEVAIGRKMKEKGIEQRLLPATWLDRGQARAWIGIKWKEGIISDIKGEQST